MFKSFPGAGDKRLLIRRSGSGDDTRGGVGNAFSTREALTRLAEDGGVFSDILRM